jgi:hypothetical protein
MALWKYYVNCVWSAALVFLEARIVGDDALSREDSELNRARGQLRYMA